MRTMNYEEYSIALESGCSSIIHAELYARIDEVLQKVDTLLAEQGLSIVLWDTQGDVYAWSIETRQEDETLHPPEADPLLAQAAQGLKVLAAQGDPPTDMLGENPMVGLTKQLNQLLTQHQTETDAEAQDFANAEWEATSRGAPGPAVYKGTITFWYDDLDGLSEMVRFTSKLRDAAPETLRCDPSVTCVTADFEASEKGMQYVLSEARKEGKRWTGTAERIIPD